MTTVLAIVAVVWFALACLLVLALMKAARKSMPDPEPARDDGEKRVAPPGETLFKDSASPKDGEPAPSDPRHSLPT